MPRIPRALIALLVVGLLLSIIWPKVRIHIFIPVSAGQAIIFFGIVVIVLFLLVDHFINRSRS